MPRADQLQKFEDDIRDYALVDEDFKIILKSFPKSAHPMGILSSLTSALIAFNPSSVDINSEKEIRNFWKQAINDSRLIAKSEAKVIPIYFKGSNSRIFQIASHLHYNLRMALLINEFGKRTVKEVVSGERDELMNIMLTSLNDSVADLGVEIIDFRVKRIDLPPNLSSSVYERMRTERNRLAEELRSEGKEIAREIRAIADKDKTVILAEAYKEAQQIRGSGDAEAAGIYAESYSQDPEFYEFTRSMKAYVETFESKSDVMLIDSDSEFFKYLNDKLEE